MNKKFSTLLAGVALLGAISANAGTKVNGIDVTKKHLYQLTTAAGSLAMDMDGDLSITNAINSANLASTLWCVEVVSQELGKAPTFEFVNKLSGRRLDIQYAGTGLVGLAKEVASAPVAVGGEIHGWAFSSQYKSGMNAASIYSAFSSDSVIGLALNATNDVVVKKMGRTDAVNEAQNPTVLTKFELQTADAVILDAKEINTILGTLDNETTGVKLTFTPDEMGEKLPVPNPFTNAKFFAEEIATPAAGDAGYVYVKNVAKSVASPKYLRVDTAYTNNDGVKFLAFNWADKIGTAAITPALIEASALKGQYKFAFTYFPSIDSLVIQAQSVYNKPDGVEWKNALVPANQTTATLLSTGVAAANNYVTVQDLIKGKVRIITIANKKESDVTLGYKGCTPVVSDKTTVTTGLYTIQNAEGKYLAMPIYGDSTIQWVSKEDNVNVWDMPSFQWVVEQTRTGSAEVTAISPIKITNREFANVVDAAAQMYLSKATAILGSNVKVSGFTAATPAVMANPYLGYRFLDKDSLLVTSYKLKYWTAFGSEDLYMGAKHEKDSVIYIGAKDNYVLASTGNAAAYGYKGTVKGLAQLSRQAYTMKSKGTKNMVVEAAENRFAVSDYVNADTAKFFFKANNRVEATGEIYYALIDTAFTVAPDSLRKVGVDENNKFLKSQIMTETRTSAFTVEADNAPLYRRLNSALLEGNSAEVSTDTLRFVESYRNEILQMEANKNFMVSGINFLGIDAASKSKDFSFTVDTAWVGRGLGYIKPQYLVSVDKVAGKTTTVTIPCAQCKLDLAAGKPVPEHCIHDVKIEVPGLDRANYLVNFVDSVAKKSYKWGKYSRVGFVDALHVGDSLYLLIDQFAGIATEKVDTAAIKAANAKTTTDRNGNGRYIKNLRGDAHKAYTWSFRYFDTEKAIEEVEAGRAFLFESLAANKADIIAPSEASWLKMQNGCLVMSDPTESTFEEITGGDDALIFNVQKGSKEDMATDVEDMTVSGVTVIASEGQVTISGAEGKKVAVTNILGQAIANTVITSNNAVISVPAGIVVVAVEGETAVKAIVK